MVDVAKYRRKHFNPKRLVSQGEIEQWILEDIDALGEITEEYSEICIDVAKGEAAYKKRKASAFLSATGTQKDREAHAEKVSSMYLSEYLDAKEEKESVYQVLWMIRNRIEVLRSLNTNLRGQVD